MVWTAGARANPLAAQIEGERDRFDRVHADQYLRARSAKDIFVTGDVANVHRSQLGLEIPIHHGSVASMQYDSRQYGGVFCYGLAYLLDAAGREKLIRDCYSKLTLGGPMIFTVISKEAPMYGRGA